MTEREQIEMIDPALAQVLEPLKKDVAVPDGVSAALAQKLNASLGVAIGGAAIGAAASASAAGAGASAATASAAVSKAAGAAVAAKAGVTSGVAAKIIAGSILLTVGVGGGVGIGYVKWAPKTERAESPPTTKARATRFDKPAAQLVAEETQLNEVAIPAQEVTRRVKAPSSPSAGSSKRTRERQLLEKAENALARGRVEAAQTTLAQHVRRYPTSSMSEERDFLIIKALYAAGQTERASTKAKTFLKRYPRSLFHQKAAKMAQKKP